MVGFGSSLRLARRPGWEEAYLDYEALKLLLTQIEATYEEESHLQQQHHESRDLDVMFLETPPGRFSSNADQVEPPRRDYRDELFLESDSDAAFEALMKYDYYSAEEEASEVEQQQQLEIEHQAAMQLQTQMHSNQHQYHPHQTNNNSPGGMHHHSNSTDSASYVQSIFSDRNPHQHQKSEAGTNTTTSALPFSLTSYSRYQDLYHNDHYGEGYANRIVDDDEDEDSQDSSHRNLNCVPSTWVTKPKQQKPKQKPPKNIDNLGLHFRPKGGNRSQFLSPGGESEFFVTTSKNTDTFLLDDAAADNQQDEDGDDDNANNAVSRGNPANLQDIDGMSTLTSFSHTTTARNPSILQKPFRRTLSSEHTALLAAPSTPATGSALFSFASQTGPVTPPAGESFVRHPPRSSTRGAPLQSASFAPAASNNAKASNPKAAQKKLEEERKRERRRRRQRRRQRAAKRKALERKVPRHIRRAHTKARDITERFLGLLRAECEKVMLFAQARLGELADTAGSLRFPAMEDQHLNNAAASSYHHGPIYSHAESAPLSPGSAAASRTPASYDYPLSDGGMHSSASSSSDGAGSEGLFYWSDSSSDESVKNHDDDSGSPNVPRSLSAYRDLQQGRHDHNKTGYGTNRTPSARNIMRSDRTDKKKHNGFDSAKRHLDHFEKLRRNKPIFQRSGNIMGEDLLLLSAVDEADGFTAVGVELMHVLRFICVNLIAVRKICRKHDRLLMNRMLGGYYHHLKLLAAAEASSTWSDKRLPGGAPQHNRQSFQDEHVQNAQTLGGLLARESADIFEPHHPAVIGQVTNYKLVGLYDANLQQLANSRTVQVISSCLVLALSEYEVSRTRANALATLNSTRAGFPAPRRGSGIRAAARHKQQLEQMSVLTGPENNAPASLDPFDEKDEYGPAESDEEGGPPSTTSSISLTRLRFTVTSIIALREAARRKKDMYSTYASRSMLAFTGRAVVGEGLDGCSRETLNFLVSYNPDAALLMDPASLNDGLKQGMWSKRSMGSVMASSLAVATTPVELPYAQSGKTLRQQEKVVISAVNILPKFKFCEVPDLFKGQRSTKTNTGVSLSDDDSFRSILRLNRASHFLYTMNYYLVHPTTITFVQAIQAPIAHSALIIGAPNVAAMLSALMHCYILSGEGKAPISNVSSLRWLFLLAALSGLAGNSVHVFGLWNYSVSFAVLGRFIVGFSCSEILHRNIVASLLPMNRLVAETAILVQAQVLGQLCGLLVGLLAEYIPDVVPPKWGIRSLSSSSFLMAWLWFMQLGFVCFCFRAENGEAKERLEANNAAEVEQMLARYTKHSSSGKRQPPQQHDSDSSTSGHGKGTLLNRTTLQLTYGTSDEPPPQGQDSNTALNESSVSRKKKRKRGRKRRIRTLTSFPNRLRQLLSYSVAVPVCLFIVLYIRFAQEVIFTSCPIVASRYFRWAGGRAGLFLAGLTAAILPMNFICGHIARKYEERTIVKKSLVVLLVGLFIMINYGSVIKLAFQVQSLFTETEERVKESVYDWMLGIVQFFVGVSVGFLGLTSLDSATLSLLSKVSPPRIRSSSVSLQLGTIVSFVSLVARLLADMQILMIGLSHRLINTDLVNSLAMPLLVVCLLIAHFVRKHFFFLM